MGDTHPFTGYLDVKKGLGFDLLCNDFPENILRSSRFFRYGWQLWIVRVYFGEPMFLSSR